MRGKLPLNTKGTLDAVSLSVYRFIKKHGFIYCGNVQKARKRKEELLCLEPGKNASEIEREYIMEKIKLVLIVLSIGLFFVICAALSSLNSGILVDGNVIERKSYGKGDLQTTLMANVLDETLQKEKVEILVNERKYTEIELEELYEQFIEELEKVIPGENSDLNETRRDILLPTYLQKFPFRVVWESSDYSLLNPDGTMGERMADEKGENVQITAQVSYFDWKKEYEKEIRVFPTPISEEQQWKEQLEQQLEEENISTATLSKFQLPTQIAGKEVSWKEVRDSPVMELFILLILVIIGVCIGMDQDLHKKIGNRSKEMMMDYPEIVSKLSLYIGAGMSIRRAWQRIALDYAKQRTDRKRYAYEEILLTSYEMESGIPESKSYDNFGKRCQVQNYLKLGTLLSQNLKKGSANIQETLQKESKAAFEERKTEARKLGEEAGTKLLFPMMLMLGIVMIVVIIPAFLSFSI